MTTRFVIEIGGRGAGELLSYASYMHGVESLVQQTVGEWLVRILPKEKLPVTIECRFVEIEP